MTSTKLNLYQKLVEVRKNVSYLKKDAVGKQYQYVSASQVIGSVKDKLNEHGLLLIPRIVGKEVTTQLNGKGTITYFTELNMEYTWIDTESGEELVVPFYSQGVDLAGEKGVGKALTYGEKNFLLKSFNIATDKDDPDAFQDKIDSAGPTPLISKEQADELQNYALEVSKYRGVKIDAVTGHFNAKNGFKLVKAIEYLHIRNTLCQWISNAKEEMMKTGQQAPGQQQHVSKPVQNEQYEHPQQKAAHIQELPPSGDKFMLHHIEYAVTPNGEPIGKINIVDQNGVQKQILARKGQLDFVKANFGGKENQQIHISFINQNGFLMLA